MECSCTEQDGIITELCMAHREALIAFDYLNGKVVKELESQLAATRCTGEFECECRDLKHATAQLAERDLDLGLTHIALEHKLKTLASAESALEERDQQLAEAREDGERLAWCLTFNGKLWRRNGLPEFHDSDKYYSWRHPNLPLRDFNTATEAIDAARKSEAGEGE